jgi:hypothetical protein
MIRRQKIALALLLPVTLALVTMLAAALARPVPAVPISSTPPQFDAANALADTVQLATDYPDRVVGSPTNARARQWLIARFTELGLPAATLPFSVTVASEARPGVQVWAASPGESGAIVLVTAHYDVPQTGIPGAADDASGVGVMLELARVFAEEPHRRTFLFMASDSEEYGHFWGAKNFAEQFQRRDRIVAVLDLDYLSARELKRINVGGVGLRRGYAPLWLRQAGLGAVEAAGVPAYEADGLLEFFFRAVPIGAADYAAYLRAGIPALNFGGEPHDAASWSAEYHTPLDTPDKLWYSAFDAYGRAAEIWLRTVDAYDPPASAPASDFRLSRTHYLPGWAVRLLQLLVFAPLFLTTAIVWRGQRPSWDEMRPEFLTLFGLTITGLDGYAAAYILVNLGLLPRYEMFPASPGDPFLLQPVWWAALVIYGTIVVFGWITFRPFRGWGSLADALEIPYRRAALLVAFSAFVIFFWQINGYSVAALLGAAGYTWPWIEPRASLRGKLLNTALALAGALPFLLGTSYFASQFPIGPWWWYLTLGAAYGLFPLLTVIAFVFGAALLLRFLRLGLRNGSRRAGL